MFKLYRKLLYILAVVLVVTTAISISIVPQSASSDDQVYTGDSKDDPKDESSDYADQ